MVCGGNRLDQGEYQYGWFLEPNRIHRRRSEDAHRAEKKFLARWLPSSPCDGLEDAIEIRQQHRVRPVVGAVHERCEPRIRAIRDLDAGITYIKTRPRSRGSSLAFGGVKATATAHREGASARSISTTEWKSVYVDYSDTLQKAQIDRPE